MFINQHTSSLLISADAPALPRPPLARRDLRARARRRIKTLHRLVKRIHNTLHRRFSSCCDVDQDHIHRFLALGFVHKSDLEPLQTLVIDQSLAPVTKGHSGPGKAQHQGRCVLASVVGIG